MSFMRNEEGELLTQVPKVYDDDRTKQSFKDSTDINKMLKKAQHTGSVSHLLKYPEPIYGEFDGEMDLMTAHHRIAKASAIFDDLPSEVRREFGNDALAFVAFANKAENKGRLAELLPAIAKPGSYFPNPVQRGGTGAGAATAPVEPAASPPEPPVEPVSDPAPSADT